MAILGVPWLSIRLECQSFELFWPWQGKNGKASADASMQRFTELLTWSCSSVMRAVRTFIKISLFTAVHPTKFLFFDKSSRTGTVLECWRKKVVGGDLVTKSGPTLETPWCVVRQAPLSMGFSRQEYWSGVPFPSPEDPTNPGIEPGSPALPADSLPTELWGKPEGRR